MTILLNRGYANAHQAENFKRLVIEIVKIDPKTFLVNRAYAKFLLYTT